MLNHVLFVGVSVDVEQTIETQSWEILEANTMLNLV
jgi:hypothetical protein